MQPEVFRFSEGTDRSDCQNYQLVFELRFLVNDNNELAGRADLLLVRMCGATPPRSLIPPMLDSIFRAIQTSPVGSNECVVDTSHPRVGRSLGESG